MKTIFFDRDGTLIHGDPRTHQNRVALLSEWRGSPSEVDNETYARLFDAAHPSEVRTLSDERDFWIRFFESLILADGISENTRARAAELADVCWWNAPRLLYRETRDVLERIKFFGYKMGVISDTFPSLKMTLEKAGIAQYLDCFICSSSVGKMKPSPEMYLAAMNALKSLPEESLYIDDCKEEADGARALGMTAFYLDRKGGHEGEWTVSNLIEFLWYIEGLNLR